MSQLIQRPDYIGYNYQGLDRGWFTQENIDTLESEPAIFQWTISHAFEHKYSAWKMHLLVVSFLGVPVSWLVLDTIFDTIRHGILPTAEYIFVIFFTAVTFLIYGFFIGSAVIHIIIWFLK